MRKTIISILVVLILMLLCGCSCEHEWTEADCLTPAVCIKCEETGMEALGHDWSDATCTEPETCTRCGAMQGLALGHSYGEWVFGEEDMTHVCSVCAFEETTEIDRGLYLETLLPGHWDYYGDFSSGELEPASSSSIVGLYLSFGDDHSVTLKQATLEAETGTWELASFRELDSITVYHIDVILESVTMTIVLYHAPSSPDNGLIVIHQETFSPAFSKNTHGVSLVTGNWGIAPNKWGYYADDRSYWFSFHDDRTVTCNVNGTFEGTWHLVPLAYSGYIYGYGVAIEYDNGGETEYLQGRLMQKELLEEDSPYEFTLKYRDNRLYLGRVNDAEFEAIQNSTNLLLGEWTSSLITEEYWDDTGTTTTDYSITFHGDGTFTADLGREHTGTWYVDYITDTRYDYYLYFDGQKEEAYCNLESDGDEIELIIRNYPGSNDKFMHFAQLSDEEAEALSLGSTLPVGTWTSYYYSVYNSDGSWAEDVFTEDYSITFHEDGTFTALLDKEMTGTWEYNTYYEISDVIDGAEHTYFEWVYFLTFHGESTAEREPVMITYIDDIPRFRLSALHPESKDLNISYDMRKYPQTTEEPNP